MIKKKLLIIVPARGGSTGLKNKNILLVNKKPLIYYSIKAAHEINEKSSIKICSTDSLKIKKIAQRYKIEVPFLRPKNISGKFSLDIGFVNHALKYFARKNITFKYGLILRPTSPARNKKNLNNAYEQFKKNSFADSMRAITIAPCTPYKMWINEKKFIKPLIKTRLKEQYNLPRQKLPKTYWQTGNFEFFQIKNKDTIKTITGKNIMGFKIKFPYISDIDTIEDLAKFKFILKNKNDLIK